MRISTFGKGFLLLSLLLLTFIGADAAEKSAKDELKELPPLSSFEVYQMGDADLIISISGKGLPLPDVSHNGNTTTVALRGARWEKENQEHRLKTVPMTTRLESEQVGRDIVITMVTDRPIQLRSTRGTAPSDSYTLRFLTAEQHQKLIEEPIVTHQPQTPRVPTGPFAVTTPVTLDLRDTELRDVFRMLGVHLKKNIIIDQSLPPALVTMTLKNVPLSEAFNYLMRTYDISYEFVGKDTIVIGTTDGLSKIAGKEEMRAYRIAYADPVALQALLVNLTKIGADRLVVDPRLRTIYATTHPAKLEEIAITIQKLDHPGRQVMLHARILQFSDGDKLAVENTLNMVYDHWWASYANGQGSGGFVDDNRLGRPSYTLPEGAIKPPVDILTPMQGTWRMFDAAFRALETKTRMKTLANPSVITIDGEEAKIDLTEDYPYISARDDAGNPTWSSKSIGPQLMMTPKVGRDGVINLKLQLEMGEVLGTIRGSGGEEMPRTSKRSVTTNVRVRNGEPFVVGGLFREDTTNNRLRIPILGQLPLLGELFTYRENSTTKSQVVMLVVPYILETPDVAIDQERVMMKQ